MAKKKWKLSAHDTVNTTAPDFEELKDYMASAARLELMYRRERELRSNEIFPVFHANDSSRYNYGSDYSSYTSGHTNHSNHPGYACSSCDSGI